MFSSWNIMLIPNIILQANTWEISEINELITKWKFKWLMCICSIHFIRNRKKNLMLVLWHTMPRHNKQWISVRECSLHPVWDGLWEIHIILVYSKCCTHPPMSNPSSNTLLETDLSLSNVGLPGGRFWRDSCCSFNWRRRFLLHNSWQSCHVGSSGGGILCKHTINYIHSNFSCSQHFRCTSHFSLPYQNLHVKKKNMKVKLSL